MAALEPDETDVDPDHCSKVTITVTHTMEQGRSQKYQTVEADCEDGLFAEEDFVFTMMYYFDQPDWFAEACFKNATKEFLPGAGIYALICAFWYKRESPGDYVSTMEFKRHPATALRKSKARLRQLRIASTGSS